jgi:hypothetical protein
MSLKKYNSLLVATHGRRSGNVAWRKVHGKRRADRPIVCEDSPSNFNFYPNGISAIVVMWSV